MLLPNNLHSQKANTKLNNEFKAVILSGYGQKLFPLVEATPKPLLPVGNEPVISYALKWCEDSAVNGPYSVFFTLKTNSYPSDILVLSPSSFSNYLSPFLRSFNSENLPNSTKSKQEDLHIRYETVDDDDCASWETADWLRHFKDEIKTDFVVLPCDILPPKSLPLSKVLESYRRSKSNTLITSLHYENSIDYGSREGPSRCITIYDQESQTLIMPANDANDTLDLRSRLLWEYPNLTLSTKLLDAHVYVVRRNVLDLLTARPEIASIREDLLPWLSKWSYQKALYDKWGKALKIQSDPFEDALAHSTMQTLENAPDRKPKHTGDYASADNSHSDVPPNQRIRVQTLIHKSGDGFIARANTLGGYAEMNREILRSHRPVPQAGKPPVAPGSLVSQPVKIGEKSLIKMSIIGRNVEIGKGCKIIGCIIADNVVVKDGAKLDNCVVCARAKVGERASLTLCDIGGDSDIIADTQAKNEKISLEE
ncbi:hypothetical protein E3Q14_00363 [Wallemia mellicola]|nr:hypothetical protein E3Q14_00363 [Wallemia mellicola]